MNWLSKLFAGDHPAAGLPASLRERLESWQTLPEVAIDDAHADMRYVVVNTEATGLDLSGGRLLAVAAIAIEGSTLAYRDAIELPLDDAAATLVELLEFVGKSPVIVFNADFNQQALMGAFETHLGFEPELTWIDAYWLMPCLFNDQHDRPVRLAEWMKSMKIETFQRHRALGDAYAIAQLFLAAQSRAAMRGQRSARNLLDLALTRKRLQRAI